jgi:hypothetical protein
MLRENIERVQKRLSYFKVSVFAIFVNVHFGEIPGSDGFGETVCWDIWISQ